MTLQIGQDSDQLLLWNSPRYNGLKKSSKLEQGTLVRTTPPDHDPDHGEGLACPWCLLTCTDELAPCFQCNRCETWNHNFCAKLAENEDDDHLFRYCKRCESEEGVCSRCEEDGQCEMGELEICTGCLEHFHIVCGAYQPGADGEKKRDFLCFECQDGKCAACGLAWEDGSRSWMSGG